MINIIYYLISIACIGSVALWDHRKVLQTFFFLDSVFNFCIYFMIFD